MNELLERLKEELNSYKNYKECPSYSKLKNRLDSINKLNIQQGWRTILIEEILQELN